MRFAALGRTHMLLDAIAACVDAGHECVHVATAPAAPEYGVGPDDFAALARRVGASFGDVEPAGAEIGISVNWPTLIPAGVRDRFPRGILNGHAGDLPRFRGNAAPNWAILLGEPRIVATVHEMADELDAGPILVQRALEIDESTYVGDVYAFLERTFPALFAQALDGLGAGTLAARPQAGEPLRCYARRPEDGELDWRLDAVSLARLVRASAEPFAGAFGRLEEEPTTVWRARAEPLREPSAGIPGQVIARRPETGEVDVLTGDGRLVLEEVETAAGRVPAAEAIRSLRARFTGTSGTSARGT
jgi:UDP-4-amino-4-deoxy-L-arabinose formyltransferase/UDP-glucuronic acid dehydrogenase (UDP-4-keto-hexauronic acid decarboxylating)